jgi:hypothetical protein
MIRFGTDLLFKPKQFSKAEKAQIRSFFEGKNLLGFDGTITELYRFAEADNPTDVFVSVEQRQRQVIERKTYRNKIKNALNNMPLATAVVPIADFKADTQNELLLGVVEELEGRRR